LDIGDWNNGECDAVHCSTFYFHSDEF
jgi:hypothetical protein